MENTSNALIIAGEILIAVLILSLFALVVVQFGSFSSQMHQDMAESQLANFNNNFTIYSYRTNITAQEVATAINFAKQANDNKELVWNDSSIYFISVYVDNENIFNSSKYINSKEEYACKDNMDNVIRKFIKDNNTKYFCCNATIEKKGNELTQKKNEKDIYYSNETGQINRIDFHTIDTSIINIPDSF